MPSKTVVVTAGSTGVGVSLVLEQLLGVCRLRTIQLLKQKYALMATTPPAPPAVLPPSAVQLVQKTAPAAVQAQPKLPLLPMVQTLLNVTDSVLHSSMRVLISTWSNPPTAMEVLKMWDLAREPGLANYAALEAVERLYEERAKAEQLSTALEMAAEEKAEGM